MGKKLELVGQRFKKLVVVEAQHDTVTRQWLWSCLCDCGQTTVVRGAALVSGNTGSCGCHKKSVLGISTTKHGAHGTRTYHIWKAMRNRCNNPNATGYELYGGRGIKVCTRWSKFENFLADMGECPKGLTLDRTDTNKGYAQKNCRWATYKQQARNMRCNRKITWQGRTLCLSEWAELFGTNSSALWKRIKRNGLDITMSEYRIK